MDAKGEALRSEGAEVFSQTAKSPDLLADSEDGGMNNLKGYMEFLSQKLIVFWVHLLILILFGIGALVYWVIGLIGGLTTISVLAGLVFASLVGVLLGSIVTYWLVQRKWVDFCYRATLTLGGKRWIREGAAKLRESDDSAY